MIMFSVYLCYHTVKWKPLDFATLLRLLQPVESSWQQLASFLIKPSSQYNVQSIQKNAMPINSNALIESLRTWLNRTRREKRTWQTLCDTAKKYEDGPQTLEQYLAERHVESEFYVILYR